MDRALEEGLLKLSLHPLEESILPPLEIRLPIIRFLRAEIDRLRTKIPKLLHKLHTSSQHLESWEKSYTAWDLPLWKEIYTTKKTLESLRKTIPSTGSDEQIVQEQRHIHLNKRMRARDGWLPLD